MTFEPTYEELQQRARTLEKKLMTVTRIAKVYRQSEGWLEAVFTANPDPVIVFDEIGHTRHLNPAFTNVFGWSMDELMGNKVPFVPKDQVAISDLKLREVYEYEKPVRFESKRLTKDGRLLDVLIHAAVIKDSKGTPKGIVINLSDITEKNKTENQLCQSRKNESLSTIVSGISSEFSRLLYVIYGNAELMRNSARAENREYLNEIVDSTKTGMDLIKQLQTFMHNTLNISNPQAINLNFEIKRIYHLIERSIPERVEINLDLSDNLYALSGERDQIEKVLLNLCINAGDAMPDGGKLTIKTENCIIDDYYQSKFPELKKGWCIKLTISDTGHGMDKEVQKRIFDPFFSTRNNEKRPGLGLSVIYGIIKSHGGEIQCGSILGVGTTFTIYLSAQAEIEGMHSSALSTSGLSQADSTIMIVDDEQSVLDLIQKAVTSLGYNVITVNSGEKALMEYYARQDQIDLILLDLAMPGMGGQICLKKLLEFDPDVKVVIASGYFGESHVKTMVNRGAKDYIVKPFSKKDLAKVIKKVLES